MDDMKNATYITMSSLYNAKDSLGLDSSKVYDNIDGISSFEKIAFYDSQCLTLQNSALRIIQEARGRLRVTASSRVFFPICRECIEMSLIFCLCIQTHHFLFPFQISTAP